MLRQTAHVSGAANHIGIALGAFQNIRIDSALRQDIYASQLPGFFLQDFYKFLANDAALFVGIIHAL